MPREHKQRSLQFAVAGSLLLAFIVLGVIAASQHLRRESESARRSYCTSHLKLIGAAMHAYYDSYGCLPPAAVTGADGSPAHSWRALLLPYIGEPELAARYRFDQPWDGPENRALWRLCPKQYQCPSDPSTGLDNGFTNYMVVVGRELMFDGDRSSTLSAIAAAASETILVAEVGDSGVCWLEPRDLDIRTMSFAVGSPTGNNISSYHNAGTQVITVDGAPHTLRSSVSRGDLKALLVAASPLKNAAAKKALRPPESEGD